ncbi:hypothetical protein CMI46_00465 [Candidatus Pacearchaeota archaeon]|nr:hypothetical protein [Candidatus Pacearchaeota archaeon]|tara:strand:- start:10180 stop:11073 length:894 start_codon:yes stop_codon:yes gene_type:complete
MELIKEAFDKVKEDINQLKSEINNFKSEIQEIQISILSLNKHLASIKNSLNNIKSTKQQDNHLSNQSDRQTDNQTDRQSDTKQIIKQPSIQDTNNKLDKLINQLQISTDSQTQPIQNKTIRQITPTHIDTSTHSSTDNSSFKGLKEPNIDISTGNQGVSTDRQTIRQTDTSTGNQGVATLKGSHNNIQEINPKLLLNQLDDIKKDLRLKVKKLTNQEMLVLSSIYQFDDQGQIIDYSFLSNQLNLSESSIRDYVQRIINKGIFLEKEKINNKKVIIKISDEFKRLASLNTLLALRDS